MQLHQQRQVTHVVCRPPARLVFFVFVVQLPILFSMDRMWDRVSVRSLAADVGDSVKLVQPGTDSFWTSLLSVLSVL